MPAGPPVPPPAPSRDTATCGNASSKCAGSWDRVPNCGGKPVRQDRQDRRSGKRSRASPMRTRNSEPGRPPLATGEWLLHSARPGPEQNQGLGGLRWNSDSTRERAGLSVLRAPSWTPRSRESWRTRANTASPAEHVRLQTTDLAPRPGARPLVPVAGFPTASE